MGRYKGGRLWIESPNGRHPPPNLPDSPLRAQYHETRYRWVMFDPKRSHAVEQCIGSRLSVSACSRGRGREQPNSDSVLLPIGEQGI
eukprot:2092313-Amphidinium_carterae.2